MLEMLEIDVFAARSQLYVKEVVFKLHERHQSMLNQQWNLKDTFLLSPDGTWQFYTYEVMSKSMKITPFVHFRNIQATVLKRVNRKRHNCVEDNSFLLTKCFDDFYMKKLNCSFPWKKSLNGSLQKCGPNDKIKDLVTLVNSVNLGNSNIIKELEEFGCYKSNCEEVKWSISSWQRANTGVQNKTFLELNFPSSSKVKTISLTIL